MTHKTSRTNYWFIWKKLIGQINKKPVPVPRSIVNETAWTQKSHKNENIKKRKWTMDDQLYTLLEKIDTLKQLNLSSETQARLNRTTSTVLEARIKFE